MFAILFSAAVAAAAPVATETAEAHFARCAILAKRDPAAAKADAESWRDKGGGIAARQCLGLAFASAENWASAASTFEQAARDAELAQDDRAVALWVQAGNAALAGDEAVRARNAFDRGLRMKGMSDEMRGEIHLDRARAGVAANDLIGARGDLDAALKLVPRDPLAWLLSATLARRQKDMPTAFAAIREAARLAPDAAEVAYEGGNVAALSGNMDDARAAWARAVRLSPASNAGQAAAMALEQSKADAPPAAP